MVLVSKIWGGGVLIPAGLHAVTKRPTKSLQKPKSGGTPAEPEDQPLPIVAATAV